MTDFMDSLPKFSVKTQNTIQDEYGSGHRVERDLAADFAGLPGDSPKENVKPSVPGTHQAREALIANDIPQTAQVDRTQAQFKPQISGEPESGRKWPVGGGPSRKKPQESEARDL
jgi:hypothetical protein